MKRFIVFGIVLLIVAVISVYVISLAGNANRAAQATRDSFSTAEAAVQLTLTAHTNP